MIQTKFKPILFSTPMVQAILEDRKTQTRRVNNHPYFSKEELLEHTLPKYNVGDILWVRETFIHWNGNYQYKPLPFGEELGKWKPSIYMPREAARIFLKVTNVRLERLQDISEADAIAEGVKQHSDYGSTGYVHYGRVDEALTDIDAVWSFETLWESINGKESWNQNPYVWVYDFERINKPADF